jgi:hypothetical protein
LETALNLDRLVVDIPFEPFRLSGGMDCFPFSSIGILMHYGDHVTTLGLDNGSNSGDGYIDNLMIVDPLNINLAAGSVDNADIVARDTSIGTTIDEG